MEGQELSEYTNRGWPREGNFDARVSRAFRPSAAIADSSQLKRAGWTAEEDEALGRLVERYGQRSWALIAKELPGRIGKQCRERYHSHLNPEVRKGEWTDEEDELIFKLREKFGNQWAMIARHVPGRTDNAVKNRWYSTMRRQERQQAASSGLSPRSKVKMVKAKPRESGDFYSSERPPKRCLSEDCHEILARSAKVPRDDRRAFMASRVTPPAVAAEKLEREKPIKVSPIRPAKDEGRDIRLLESEALEALSALRRVSDDESKASDDERKSEKSSDDEGSGSSPPSPHLELEALPPSLVTERAGASVEGGQYQGWAIHPMGMMHNRFPMQGLVGGHMAANFARIYGGMYPGSASAIYFQPNFYPDQMYAQGLVRGPNRAPNVLGSNVP